MKTKIVSMLAILFTALACSTASSTPMPQEATQVSPPTVIVVVTDTPAAPATEEPSQSSGTIIYDNGADILSVNPNTGEASLLISRDELETNLAKDRSVDSYTYGGKHPLAISLSPDQSKALVTICADLDVRYRCLFADFVYSLDTKTGVQLPVPPDAYGVYWQWSPDGSKLAGAAWSYDRAIYHPAAFFAVNNDGSNLTPLEAVINDRWQMAWSPDGTAVYPLGFVANFQSVFVDRTKPADIELPGLDGNAGIECLAFSPDGSKAVFAVRQASPKNHERFYIANSDFLEVTQLTEYDIDPRYFCKLIWSPDGRFVHIRFEYDTRKETGDETSGTEPRKDKLVNIETASLLETPRDLLACGWTPDSNLLYTTKTGEGGLQILTPGNNNPVDVPSGMQPVVSHCPLLWLDGD